MTVYVGIDFAKKLHFATIMNHDGVLSKPFSFENNDQGFSILLSHCTSYKNEDLLFGFESTAHYQDNLAYYLKQKQMDYVLINTLQVSALRKANIRNTKTDRVDANLICIALYQFHHTASTRASTSSNELYQLCITRDQLVTKRSRSKIQFVSYLDRIFPELAGFFKGNLHINTSYRLLEKYPLPSLIKKTRIDVLTKLLLNASHGRYGKSRALELKELAGNSVGIPSEPLLFKLSY